jgi:phospholipid transport system substrate-binding protein
VRKYLISALFLALIGLFTAPAQAQQTQQSARTTIEQFHADLIGVMKEAKTLGFEGRRTKLQPAVERTFDLQFMAQYATGGAWDTMQPAQRQALVDLFRRMTVSTYASRFTGYSGQEFKTVEAKENGKDVLVRTMLRTGEGEDVAIDYLMRAREGSWKIVDVYFKRISELATRRSEYSSVIRREGVPALLQTLENKVKDIEAGKVTTEPGKPSPSG